MKKATASPTTEGSLKTQPWRTRFVCPAKREVCDFGEYCRGKQAPARHPVDHVGARFIAGCIIRPGGATAATIGRAKLPWSIRSADRLACLDLSVRRYHCAIFDAADAPNPELVYLNYLETCRRLGIEPVPRGRALGLIGEWIEVLTGRPESDDPETSAMNQTAEILLGRNALIRAVYGRERCHARQR